MRSVCQRALLMSYILGPHHGSIEGGDYLGSLCAQLSICCEPQRRITQSLKEREAKRSEQAFLARATWELGVQALCCDHWRSCSWSLSSW